MLKQIACLIKNKSHHNSHIWNPPAVLCTQCCSVIGGIHGRFKEKGSLTAILICSFWKLTQFTFHLKQFKNSLQCMHLESESKTLQYSVKGTILGVMRSLAKEKIAKQPVLISRMRNRILLCMYPK